MAGRRCAAALRDRVDTDAAMWPHLATARDRVQAEQGTRGDLCLPGMPTTEAHYFDQPE
ncbi:MAG TPA: hypothetical protein VE442_09575 [Jatrophihabitans sp.]|nr:hypothetical protein [Jatrophihabitans sp.]